MQPNLFLCELVAKYSIKAIERKNPYPLPLKGMCISVPLIIVYLAQCPKNKIQVSPSKKVGALGNVRLIAAVCRGAEKIFLKPPCAHGLDLSALGQNANRSGMCLRVCEGEEGVERAVMVFFLQMQPKLTRPNCLNKSKTVALRSSNTYFRPHAFVSTHA